VIAAESVVVVEAVATAATSLAEDSAKIQLMEEVVDAWTVMAAGNNPVADYLRRAHRILGLGRLADSSAGSGQPTSGWGHSQVALRPGGEKTAGNEGADG